MVVPFRGTLSVNTERDPLIHKALKDNFGYLHSLLLLLGSIARSSFAIEIMRTANKGLEKLDRCQLLVTKIFSSGLLLWQNIY